jgi:hypothetical protein
MKTIEKTTEKTTTNSVSKPNNLAKYAGIA